MRIKKPYPTSFEEVHISRQGDSAIIDYLEPGVSSTNFCIGPRMREMSDREIFNLYNDGLLAVQEMRRQNPYIAVEIPLGKPQIKYSQSTGQWCSRGDVVRGVISSDDGKPIIEIDKHDLTMEEFGTLLSTYMGWGMRLIFVPDDEIHLPARVTIRNPKRDET